jgi:hypothetical protein
VRQVKWLALLCMTFAGACSLAFPFDGLRTGAVDAGVADTGSGDASPCAAGEALCLGRCIDVLRDPRNCGACQNNCIETSCKDALCVPTVIAGTSGRGVGIAVRGDEVYWLVQSFDGSGGTGYYRASVTGSPPASGEQIAYVNSTGHEQPATNTTHLWVRAGNTIQRRLPLPDAGPETVITPGSPNLQSYLVDDTTLFHLQTRAQGGVVRLTGMTTDLGRFPVADAGPDAKAESITTPVFSADVASNAVVRFVRRRGDGYFFFVERGVGGAGSLFLAQSPALDSGAGPVGVDVLGLGGLAASDAGVFFAANEGALYALDLGQDPRLLSGPFPSELGSHVAVASDAVYYASRAAAKGPSFVYRVPLAGGPRVRIGAGIDGDDTPVAVHPSWVFWLRDGNLHALRRAP